MTTKTPELLALQASVTGVLNAHDLLGVLPYGAPEDEYDPEMKDIVRLIAEGVAITPEVVATVWHKWFEDSWGHTTSKVEPATPAMEALAADLQAIQHAFGPK